MEINSLKRELVDSKEDGDRMIKEAERKFLSELNQMKRNNFELGTELESLRFKHKSAIEDKDQAASDKIKSLTEKLNLYGRGFLRLDSALCKALSLPTSFRGSAEDVTNHVDAILDSLEKLMKRIAGQVKVAENAVEDVKKYVFIVNIFGGDITCIFCKGN